MVPFLLPPGYRRIQVVDSFAALLGTPLDGETNAVCWPRDLAGDFDEVVRRLPQRPGVTPLDDATLAALPVGARGRLAITTLCSDLRRLREAGHAPELDIVASYPRDDGPVPTDVHSFHVDSATVPTETFLCTYSGAPSEGLRDDEAVRCVDVPDLREQLRRQFGGDDGPVFERWLHEHCFDRHFRPTAAATPFSFGVGNLWRLAVQHPASRVPACIHRAPPPQPGAAPRLVLIS